jgi:hypothetical protein
MMLDFVLVAAAAMVFVSLIVVSLIIGRKETGRKAALRSGLRAKRALENRGPADVSGDHKQQDPPGGEGTSRHIYDFFA